MDGGAASGAQQHGYIYRRKHERLFQASEIGANSHLAFTYALDLVRTYHARPLILHVSPDPVFVYPDQLTACLESRWGRYINGVSGIRPGGSVKRIKNTILSF